MRVVLDTNILVRANKRAQGPARQVLSEICSATHCLVMSPFLLTELVRVLNYPRVQAQYRLTPEEIQQFADELQQMSEVVAPEAGDPATTIAKDPDDNPVIQTAVLGKAEVLCSLDRHFHQADVQSYCAQHGIRVLTDVELLALIRSSPAQP